ncbi:MAG TPA: peptidoglycan DD-metalloendopeptidase family protein [Candidatus Paceibacterota bacterium]|nr:peptidoglycan DD-metalloendopeptidase family protein [Candidatus Paceibacterota bacterium]
MTRTGFSIFFFVLCTGIVLGTPNLVRAGTASDIQSQINANNSQITSLEADIATYQRQLDALGTQKNTLQSTVNSLTLSQKQLASQIKITQSKISSANLQILELTSSIGNKETIITADQDAIAKALRDIAEGEQAPFVVQLISSDSLGAAWQATDQAVQFNQALTQDISDLRTTRTALTTNRDAVSAQKAQLVSLQNDLTLQKRSVDASVAAQKQLLMQTKNQEANYQKLIAQKQASEQSFEQELINLQSQLNLTVNPNSLPKVGTGILSWPFSAAFMFNCTQRKNVFGNLFCITQYFGNTPFSTANPQIYSGHGHDGIDIAAPIGTPVHAALAGTVLATGNTDLVHDSTGRQCYSFGKWIMLVHGNGINTMYAHLSEIDVSKGQSVSTGQIIGLSGMTGYATGPHLHFGVYATQGTEIMTLRQFRGATIGCADAMMPVATLTAYLNPLSYL